MLRIISTKTVLKIQLFFLFCISMMPKIIKILSPIHFLVCLSALLLPILLHSFSLFLSFSTPQKSVHCTLIDSYSTSTYSPKKSGHFSLKNYESEEDENDRKSDDDHKNDALTEEEEIYEQFKNKTRNLNNFYNYYPVDYPATTTDKNYVSKASIVFTTRLVCLALVALFSFVASILRCCLREREPSRRESRARENNEPASEQLALVVVLGRENSISSVLLAPVSDHQCSPENPQEEEVADLPPTYDEILQSNGNHQGETVVNYHHPQQQEPPPPPYSSDL